MDAAPDYSIVLPAYNEAALLPATLAAAARGDGRDSLCAARSSCATTTRPTPPPRRPATRGARVVFEPVNQISRARNTGARAARGRLLVFVDADTLVPAPLLAKALDALATGRACGGGAAVAMEGISGGLAGRMVSLWNGLSRGRRLAAGSFVFCLREAFLAVGGFSEQVYASEEIWLSRALKRWGRPRGLEFLILDDAVTTSGRKARWYPAPLLLAVMLGFVICPWLVRSRHYCWLWYRRPAHP